jgi:hypothetical protein
MSNSVDLTEIINVTPWIDTHEHLIEERHRLREDGFTFVEKATGEPITIPGDWTALLANYAIRDLVSSGMPTETADCLLRTEREPVEKWEMVAPYYEATRSTGYLREIDLTTERLFGLRLSRDTCEDIDRSMRDLRKQGYYSHVLHEVANIARCQVNSVEDNPFCETGTPDIFDEDLCLVPLILGGHDQAERASGIEVGSLDDYVEVLDWCFERYGDQAVAVKCPLAYVRSLAVAEVNGRPRRAFQRLRQGVDDLRDRRKVEDFLLRRCLELATDRHLPVKLHMGYLDGNRLPETQWVFSHVCDVTPMIQANPRVTFVLMHMAWPQQEQVLALAKHYPNVVVDLCWSWIASPISTCEFVQRFLTTAPATKLLCFGGDYSTIENVVGHAEIARRGLQVALESLVDRDWLNSEAALKLVPELMNGNANCILPTRG